MTTNIRKEVFMKALNSVCVNGIGVSISVSKLLFFDLC